MRYDRLYDRLVRRALGQIQLDLESFFEAAIEQGMSLESAQAQLIDDLDNAGPIFGKFLRHVTGAAENTVMEAGRQGVFAGELKSSGALAEIEGITQADIDAAIDAADPDRLGEIEREAAPRIVQAWIAELVNTCYKCLPLHGVEMLAEEWDARGLHPASMHDGWVSVCHCRRIDVRLVADRDELIAPLLRTNVTKVKGARKTARAVAQQDIDKSLQTVARVRESQEGRRVLRLLGTSGGSVLMERQGQVKGQPQ